MDLQTLRGFADLMEEHGLTRLKIEEPELTLEMERGCTVAAAPVATVPAAAPAAPAAGPAPAAAPAAPAPATPGTAEVCAPMVGVFYVASAPGAEPFVRVGSKVKKGETLCILEAMKLMNEVVAECDGEVAEICANDGELVEYGRVLFRIYER